MGTDSPDRVEGGLPIAEIERLVDQFYDRVRGDPVLGPVFNPAVHDWAGHKRTLVSFWSSVALRSNTYRGNPMAAHRPHPIEAAHFDHWLGLWRETADEVLSPGTPRCSPTMPNASPGVCGTGWGSADASHRPVAGDVVETPRPR